MFQGFGSGFLSSVLPLEVTMDASRAAVLGHPKGTLPTGGEFVGTLPREHPPEHKIIHLELSTMHEPLMITLERMVVPCIFIVDYHLRSSMRLISSHWSWSCMALSYVWTRREPMVTSGGRMALASYTKKKGVSAVSRLGDVQFPHNAHESSSIHFLQRFSKPS
jgi:hypothetical protein